MVKGGVRGLGMHYVVRVLTSIVVRVSVCVCVCLSHWPFPFLQNHVNPAVDFTQIPPGMLALDNMLYFARHHQDAYIRVRMHVHFQLYSIQRQ